jgi:hypothetical protein
MRFRLAEALAGRIKSDALGLDQRAKIGQPSLGARDVVIDDDKKTMGQVLSESRDYYGVARAMESANRESRCGRGHLPKEILELSERFHDGEQLRERHGAR